VLLAILVGAAIRVALAVNDNVITNDATAYLRSGESVWAGDGFRRDGAPELHFPPVYPVLVGGAERALGSPQRATVTITWLASTLLLVPLASIGRRLGGNRAGLATVWVGALAPGLTDVPVSSGSGNEVVFLLIVLVALRLALVAHDSRGLARHAAAVGAGALIGLTYLTRPEGLVYAGVAVGVLFGSVLLGRTSDWRSRLVSVGLFVVGLSVIVAPYASYLHHNTGKWELTAKATDPSIESWRSSAEHDREARDAVLYALDPSGTRFLARGESLIALARAHPSSYLGIVGINLRELWRDVVVPVQRSHPSLGWDLMPAPLSAFALWGAWRGRRSPTVLLLGAALLAPTITALAFFVQARYLIPASAVVCLAVGVAFVQLPRRALRPVAIVSGLLLVLSLATAMDGADGFLNRREPVEHRLVGQWLEANTSVGARIMTRSMIVEYYAKRRAVPVPYADPAAVLRFARHYGVDFIVVDAYNYRDLRPQLMDWLTQPPPGTAVVHRLEQSGRDTIVLQVSGQEVPEASDPPRLGFTGDG
jgi:hypothetical protein